MPQNLYKKYRNTQFPQVTHKNFKTRAFKNSNNFL